MIDDPKQLLAEYKTLLKRSQLSHVSVKNYMSDVRKYLTWTKALNLDPKDSQTFKDYKAHLIEADLPTSTINRAMSSLRRFGRFLSSQNLSLDNPTKNLTNHSIEQQSPLLEPNRRLHTDFEHFLSKEPLAEKTTINYLSDLNRYLLWVQDNVAIDCAHSHTTQACDVCITQTTLDQDTATNYIKHLESDTTKTHASILRKVATLNRFRDWADKSGRLSLKRVNTIEEKIRNFPLPPQVTKIQDLPSTLYPLRSKTTLPILALFLLLPLLLLTNFYDLRSTIYDLLPGYSQQARHHGDFTLNPDGTITVYPLPSTLYPLNTSPGSVKGITTQTDASVSFNSVIDTNYNFGVTGWIEGDQLRSTTVAQPPLEVASNLVVPNLNADLLDGFNAATPTGADEIVATNSSGDITLTDTAPTINAESGTLGLTGNGVSIRSNSASDGNITIAPDGAGTTNIRGSNSSGDTVSISNANQNSGNLVSGSVGNNNTSFNFITFQSGSTPTTRFQVDASGNVYLRGGLEDANTSTPVAVADAVYTSLPAGTNSILGALNTISSGTNLFTDSGTITYLTSTSDDLAIGASSLAAPLSVDVSANKLRLGTGSTANATIDFYASDGDTGALSYTTDDQFYFSGGTAYFTDAVTVASGTLTGSNSESLSIGATDDIIAFNGAGGTDNTNLYIDLDGAYPVLYSNTDSAVGIDDDLTFVGPQSINTSSGNLTLNPSGSLVFSGLDCTGNSNGGALTANASGVVTCSDDDSGSGGSGTTYWRLASGAFSPVNDTADLLVGSNASSSAKFAVLNVNSGTPTASVSAGTAGAAYLTAAGTLQTTANQSLTLGGSTTGNIALNENTSITGTLDVSGAVTLSTIGSISDNNLVLTSNSGVVSSIDTTAWDKDSSDDFASFTVTADSGSPETILTGNQITFTGGTNLNSAVSATDTITFNLDAALTDLTSAQFGTGNVYLTGTTVGLTTDTNLVSLADNALTVNGTLTATGNINSSGGTIQTNSTNRIDNSGNLVNIGTTQFNTVTYTWPGADGSNGYVLATNGSGTLSWTDSTALSGSIWERTLQAVHTDQYWADSVLVGGTASSSADITLNADGSAVFNEQGADADFRIEASGQANAFFIQGSDGFVGIGTSSPNASLQILSNYNNTGATTNLMTSDSNIVAGDILGTINFQAQNSGGAYQNLTGARIQAEADAGYSWTSSTEDAPTSLNFYTQSNGDTDNLSSPHMTITSTGFVGLSTTNPGQLLEIYNGGNTKLRFNLINTGANIWDIGLDDNDGNFYFYDGSNKVLGLDTSGNTELYSQGQLRLYDSDSSNYTGFVSPATLGGNYVYTLPTSYGSNGQALTTDGAGTLTWSDVLTAASVYWQLTGETIHPKNADVYSLSLGGTASSSADITLNADGSAVFNEQGNDADFRIEGTTNSNIFFVDASTNSIGIGTSSPSNLLELVSNNGTATPQLYIDQEGGGDAGIAIDAGGDVWTLGVDNTDGSIAFYDGINTATTEVLTLTQNYLLGFGDPTPEHKLDVEGSYAGNALVTLNETGSNDIFTASSSGTTRMVLDTNGQLGLGTTQPTGLLNIRTTADSQNFIRFTTEDDTNFSIRQVTSGANADLAFYSNNTSVMQFYDNDVDTVQIPGELSLGTFNANNKLTVRGGAAIGTDVSYYQGTAPSNGLIVEGQVGIGTTSATDQLTVSGNVGILAQGDLRLYDTDSSNYTGFVSPATLGGNYVYTLPTSYGSNGQALTTDGAGTLTWSDVLTAASVYWQLTGETIHPKNADVYSLSLGGTASSSADITLNADGSAVFNEQGADADFRIEGSGQANAFFIQGSDGFVGIGTNNPTYNLDVTGNVGIDDYIYHNGDGDTYLRFTNDAFVLYAGNDIALSIFEDSTPTFDIGGVYDVGINNSSLFVGGSEGNYSGLVGIGSTSPAHPLDIQGGYAGNALVTLNETNGNDIFTASSSGTTRLTLGSDGNLDQVSSVAAGNQFENDLSTTISSGTINTNSQGGYLFETIVDGASSANVTSYGTRNSYQALSVDAASATLIATDDRITYNTPNGSVGTIIGNEARTAIQTAANVANITNMISYRAAANISEALATVTNRYGLYVEDVNPNNGTLTSQYGVYVPDLAAAANNYALYTNAGDVRFGDKVLIEGSSDVVQTTIKANSSQTANLTEWQDSSGTSNTYITSKQVLRSFIPDDDSNLALNITSNVGSNNIADVSAGRFIIDLVDAVNSRALSGAPTALLVKAFDNVATAIDNASGILITPDLRTASTLNNYYGLVFDTSDIDTTNLSSLYGVYVGNVTQATNNYALYTNAGDIVLDAASDADTNLSIGTTTPIGKLTLEGGYAGNALAVLNETNGNDIITASASGTTRMVLTNNGDIVLGGQKTTANNAQVYAFDSSSLTSGSTYTGYFRSVNSSSGSQNQTGLFADSYATNNNQTGNYTGLQGRTTKAGTGTLDDAIGVRGEVYNNAGGTVTNAKAVETFANVSNSSTITNLYSLYVNNPSNTSSTITSNYGLYLEDQTTGSTNYSIYTNAGDIVLDAASDADTNLSIGTTTPIGKLTLEGGYAGNALVSLNETNGNDIFTASASGTTRLSLANNGELRFFDSDASNYAGFDVPSALSGNYIFTLPDGYGSNGQALTTDGSGNLSWADAATGTSILWELANGAIYPKNNSADFLVGGQASSSAKFAVLNVNSGTPTASVSAGVAGASYLTATGTLQTTANQTLSLGGSTTGDILLNNDGTNQIGIGTTDPAANLDIHEAVNSPALRFTNDIQQVAANDVAHEIEFFGQDTGLQQEVANIQTLAVSDWTPSGTETALVFNIVNTTGSTLNPEFAISATGAGVGTTAPQEELHVYGSQPIIRVEGAKTGTSQPFGELEFYNTDVTSYIGSRISSYNDGGTDDGDLRFYTANNAVLDEKLRITSTGVSVNSTAADYDFVIAGDTDTNLFYVDAGNDRVGIGDNTPAALFTVGSGDSFQVDASGNITTAGTLAVNGDIISSDGNLTINATGYTRVGDAGTPGSANGDDDLYVEGDLEVDGVFYADGGIDTAFTQGSLVFAGASGVLSEDNTNLFYNDTDNLIGVGTNSPASRLHVHGQYAGNALVTLNSTNTNDILTASSSGTTRFRLDTNGYVHSQRFSDLSNSAYFLDPAATATALSLAGNAGIGTATPEHRLQVFGSNAGKALVAINETGTDNDIFTASASGTTRFVIDYSGNVGIGTSAPTSNLSVGSSTTNHVGDFLVSDINTRLLIENTGAAADNRVWDTFAGDTSLSFRVVDDADSVAANWLTVGRTGTTVDSISLPSGNVGIGAAAQTASKLYINESYAVTADRYGLRVNTDQSNNGAATLRGADITATYAPDALGTLTGLNGLDINLTSDNGSGTGGTVSNAVGLSATANNAAGITLSDLRLLRAAAPTNSGTITSLYGLYIDSMTAGGTNYAIYSAGGQSYFAGNVGIGSITPAKNLDVTSGSSTEGIAIDGNLAFSSGDTWLRINQSDEFSSGVYTPNEFRVDGGVVFNENATAVDFRVEGDTQTHLFYVDGTNDEVGINDSTPDAQLDIDSKGTSNIIYRAAESDGGELFRLTEGSAGDAIFDLYNAADTNTIQLHANTGVDSWIAAGDFGVGTTNPAYKLDVLASGTGIIARFNSANTTGCSLATGGTITCTSDRRLKKDITGLELDQGLDLVSQLNPVSYRWNYEDGTAAKSLGFIAQDVEALLPQLILTEPETGYKQLNTVALVPVLTKAIQQQQLQLNEVGLAAATSSQDLGNITAQITDLDYQLNAQQSTIDDLRSTINDLRSYLKASLINAEQVVTNSIETSNITALTSNLQSLTSSNIKVGNKLTSPLVETAELTAQRSNIEELRTKNLSADNSSFGDLVAERSTLDALRSNTATISGLVADTADVRQLTAETGYFDELITSTISAKFIAGLDEQVEAQLNNRLAVLQDKLSNLNPGVEEQSGQTPGLEATTKEDLPSTIYPLPSDDQFSLSPTSSTDELIADGQQLTDYSLPELTLTDAQRSTLYALPSSLASASADLAGTTFGEFDAIFVNDFLAVTGLASIVNLDVTDYMTIGGTLLADGNSISTIKCTDGQGLTADGGSNTLFIQPSGGNLNLLAGLMTLDEAGQVTISGDLQVTGALAATNIQSDSVATQKLALAPSPESPTPNANGFSNLLEVRDNLGNLTASINASGSGQFNKVKTKELIIASASTASTSAQTPTSITYQTNATTGTSTLPAGKSEVIIENPAVTNTDLIYITPVTSTNNQVIYISSKVSDNPATPTNDAHFTVTIDSPINRDIEFNWWIIKTE